MISQHTWEGRYFTVHGYIWTYNLTQRAASKYWAIIPIMWDQCILVKTVILLFAKYTDAIESCLALILSRGYALWKLTMRISSLQASSLLYVRPLCLLEANVENNRHRVNVNMPKKFTYFVRRYEFGFWLWMNASVIAHLFWPAMPDALSNFCAGFVCS